MKYILAMISDYSDLATMTPEESQALEQQLATFHDELKKAGAWVSAEGIAEPAAASIERIHDGSCAANAPEMRTSGTAHLSPRLSAVLRALREAAGVSQEGWAA